MSLRRLASGPTIVQVRLWSGLIIGIYATLHLSNHALGLVSVHAQEVARPYFMWFWHTLLGQFLLYGSLIVHAILALHSLIRRRHYKMPMWERTQIVMGLAVPYLLLVHITNTRGTRILTGIDIDYVYEIAMLWVDPIVRFKQVLLVLLVWSHFAIGLHFWLRFRPGYRRAFPVVLLLLVLIPSAALIGFAEIGKEMTARKQADPAWYDALKAKGIPADPENAKIRKALREWSGPAWLGIVGLVGTFAIGRRLWLRNKTFTVTYSGGGRVRAPLGMSILEVSRLAGRPHMSVCGGRARCTTCRVMVNEGAEHLHRPSADEQRALDRIGAPPGLRLACQTRPKGDVDVQPLLNPTLASFRGGPGPEFGQEREVTVLFIDVRGSTKLAEKRLPFDVVFLLNHFFEEMAAAVEAADGHYSNFTGDGLMALFGLRAGRDRGARSALACAASMLLRLERINQRLAGEIETPITIGIGIHTGVAIIGRMGPPKAPFVTALGDTVNTTARLEGLTKELGVPVVVSVYALDAAGVPRPSLLSAEIRGRTTRMPVAALDLDGVRELLSMPASSVSDRMKVG